MASRSFVSGCGRFLTSSDGHDRCPSCLGFRHAEAALVDESCSHCGNMTMAMLRSRYLIARCGGIPLALPRSSSSGRRTTSAQGQGDLRITVRASPSSTSPRASHSSSTSHRLGFPDEYAGSSDRAGPSISFGAPADDGISITASGDELGSGEDDLAALPPSGRVALPESDPELTAMLSRAAESIGLHYRRPPSPERSRLGDWFLGAQAERRQPPPVPFFPEVHEEVTRSWKAPFSARNRPSASSVLTTLDGGVAQGYVEVPGVLQERLRKYAFPPVSLLAQTLCKVREDEEQVLLVAPYWPNRTWFPELMLLATAPPWQIPLRRDLLSQRGGTLWHPRPDLWNLHVWSLDGTRRF